MAAHRCCCRCLLFFKIEVRPRSCRSYHIWRPCVSIGAAGAQTVYLWDVTFSDPRFWGFQYYWTCEFWGPETSSIEQNMYTSRSKFLTYTLKYKHFYLGLIFDYILMFYLSWSCTKLTKYECAYNQLSHLHQCILTSIFLCIISIYFFKMV